MLVKFSYYHLQICVYLVTTMILTEAYNLCSKCKMSSTSQLIQYCSDNNSTGHQYLSESCCINKTSDHSHVTLGVDLSNCSLKSVKGLFTAEIHLRLILLEGNKDLQIVQSDFKGLTKLEYMSLPKGLQCPGGNESWNSTEQTQNAIFCVHELDLCDKVSCPNNNSYCSMIGPGDVECLCNYGYHGYKCFRQGNFPTAVYTVSLCSITVVLSLYLWCIQRRKAKRH